MVDSKADIESDIDPAIDRGESTGRMEPMLVPDGSPRRSRLDDLAVELASRSAGFRRSLPEGVLEPLSDLVRAMNCYYSNLIEGHDTHPVDIERALKSDFSAEPKTRNLQLEAKAHIAVQQWIDEGGGLHGREFSADGICEIHRRFGEGLPEDLLWAEELDTDDPIKVVPGELRDRDVTVGRHVPISPGAVPRFLDRFDEVYSNTGKAGTILGAAAAHHRLLWIHPFLDGNGRVARLVSHATLFEALDTGGVWSVARGLAGRVADYKSHLAACDLERRNDLDGRGHLSEEALASFTQFFLETCLDQVSFMEGLVEPNRLRARILLWVEEEMRVGDLPERAGSVLEAVLFRGQLPRGEVAPVLGVSDRHARRVVSALTERRVLASESPRSPLHIAFPAELASRWMPGLFPERTA
ncbi:MAG: Fic family protein [Deltaproteobacteria bacterium]|nr:Fic family protein [Deltaproteobacteria bacterium]MBW2223472.1 Fic family protein [Deltaproteobacteria bacterium]MBW2547970.1 Fic family protein [Deltaproteobacteria bacterium]MBW2719015.1 Fic family protein [Deltaproteobacteria bacterium]